MHETSIAMAEVCQAEEPARERDADGTGPVMPRAGGSAGSVGDMPLFPFPPARADTVPAAAEARRHTLSASCGGARVTGSSTAGRPGARRLPYRAGTRTGTTTGAGMWITHPGHRPAPGRAPGVRADPRSSARSGRCVDTAVPRRRIAGAVPGWSVSAGCAGRPRQSLTEPVPRGPAEPAPPLSGTGAHAAKAVVTVPAAVLWRRAAAPASGPVTGRGRRRPARSGAYVEHVPPVRVRSGRAVRSGRPPHPYR
ncbi:hypothetical protein SUDANB19_05760 [Streptomyces sp. enrichment culture]